MKVYSKKILKIIIIIALILIVFLITCRTIPKKPQFITENIASNIDDYLYSIYDCECSKLINLTTLNWLWDTVPHELQGTVNTNLIF